MKPFLRPASRFFLPLLLILLYHQPAAAQNLEKTLLWKISGNGLSEASYLYGTMHTGDKRAHKFSKSVMPAFQSCKALAGELKLDDINRDEVLEGMTLKEGSVRDYFANDNDYNSFAAWFKERMHVPLETFQNRKPMFVYSLVMQTQYGNEMGQAVDQFFFEEAKKAGKSTHGLETMKEQLNAFDRIPKEDQAKMLLDLMKDDGSKKAQSAELIKYYSKRDLNKMYELYKEMGAGQDFETALVSERNVIMAARMQPLMREQATFVAVGALHLAGPDGIIALLRQAGYTVEPVK